MPLYEYECEACGHRFEVIQKFSDPRKRRCPKCEGKLRRLISAPGLQFKGSGWYVTDYARKGSAGAEPAGTEGASSGSSEGKSADSKPEEGKAAPVPKARPGRRAPPARRRKR